MKISTIIGILIKIIIGIALVYIGIGIYIHIFDIYVLRDSFFIGIPLLCVGLILHLILRIYLNIKAKKSIVIPSIFLAILVIAFIAMVLLFGMIMTSVGH